jgi:hypothetical protein
MPALIGVASAMLNEPQRRGGASFSDAGYLRRCRALAVPSPGGAKKAMHGARNSAHEGAANDAGRISSFLSSSKLGNDAVEEFSFSSQFVVS